MPVNEGKNTDTHSEYLRVILITVNSNTKYFVARQECKTNPLLHFCGNIKHFYIVDSYTYGDNKKEMLRFHSKTMIRRTRNNVTL
jgi:hypothetical protein